MLRTAAILALLAAPAAADEMWTTPDGDAFWDIDVDGTSVFSVAASWGTVRLYVPGMTERVEKRGVHAVYWIAEGAGPCGATLTGPDGVASTDWGLGSLSFDRATFPTGWTATLGRCGDTPSFGLRAEPF